MNRINGFLDLDNYFIKILGRKFENEQELIELGLIAEEPGGKNNKFWIVSEGKMLALFKEQPYYNYEAYAELFSEEVCKLLNIPTAHYDLAKFNDKYGVISYNFIIDDYYPGYDIIADFYEEILMNDENLSELYGINNDDIDSVTDKLNNLEDIWTILEKYYENNPDKQKIVFTIVSHLVDKLIFDILMINADDHCDNWGLMNNNLSPLFDNARILNMHNNVFNEVNLEDKKLLFTVDNSGINKPLEVLERFMSISSSEYNEYLINKVKILEENILNIPLIIEKRIEYSLPPYLKQYFIDNLTKHLEEINKIIIKKSR